MDGSHDEMTRREWMQYGTVAAMSSLTATQDSQTPPSFLIRKATIVTMDSTLGDISAGDVLIRDGEIAAVGRDLSASAEEIIDGEGCIVLPGFIDGHRHLWHSAMKNYHDVWGYGQYRREGISRHSVCYSPEDMRIGSYAGGLEALKRVKESGKLVGVDWPATAGALTASRDRIVELAKTVTLALVDG